MDKVISKRSIREMVLRKLYELAPFDLHGDVSIQECSETVSITCIINFFGRIDLLEGILYSLILQNFPRNLFEIILVEDRGGTAEGRAVSERFSDKLPIRYIPLDANFGCMGYSRNFGLKHSRGKYILFLDDDTVIQQENFLEIISKLFNDNPSVDALVPYGSASYSLIKDKYSFHDPYFMTSRCTAYRRTVLGELGGFINNFIGQEDVEFVVRFSISGKKYRRSSELCYFHPPLLVPNLRKPKAVGYSFSLLKIRYSKLMWLLVIINCCRHAPLYLLPQRKFKEMGRFGIGFLLGVFASVGKNEKIQYS